MDDDEKELFSNSVNASIRQSTGNKDGQQSNGMPGRKVSISGSATTPGGYGLPSPGPGRGFGRRRETSESYPFPNSSLASPTVGRDDQRAPSPPPSLIRRRTDRDIGKSQDLDKDDDKPATTPFGTLKRTGTGPLSGGFGGPSSPWSAAPQSAGLSPMGSFGNFGLGGQSSDKRAGGTSGRAESRFKNLLSKDSNEDMASPTVQRKSSMSSLSRVNENESWRPLDDPSATLPETDEELSGSAALGPGSDLSPPHARHAARGFGTPSRSSTVEEGGIGAFGMTSDNAMSGQGFLQGRDAFHQTPSAQRSGMGQDPLMSPDTNPYRSPEQQGVERLVEEPENDGPDMHSAPLRGLGGFGHDHGSQLGGLGGLGSFGRVQGNPNDRSQNSSAAGNRAFPGLGGLGQLGSMPSNSGWPATQPGFGTPGRQNSSFSNAFGGGIFATSAAEMQSPSLAGLGGPNPFGGQSAGGFGGSRMASMFPSAMQDQMRQVDLHDSGNDRAAQQPFGNLGGMPGDMSNPFGGLGPMGQQADMQQPAFGAANQHPPPMGDQSDESTAQPQQPQPPGSSASNQPPAPQQRTMVMPDRMRWIYRDPQGQTQGPWTGLEMHDWYKAGFFSPELLVKKYEDTDYEPLAQLIRRIGNSREPFLVPQIGIPHGAPSAAANPTAWAGPTAGISPPGPTSAGGVQPPFASSFPSFGTTLTADQQNALERRKQEEQYLMARQKEHLAQAQMAQRMQVQPGSAQHALGGGAGNLNHQTSHHSLHSQPSFGSMTSPSQAAYQPSPSHGPSANQPGFFDNSFRAPQGAGLGAVGAGVDSLGHIREEEIPNILDRLDLSDRTPAGQFGAPGQPIGQQQTQGQSQHEQQVQQMMQDRARLQQEQAQHDALQQQTGPAEHQSNERLQQFQQLQGQGLDPRFGAAVSKPAAPLADQQAAPQQRRVATPPQEPMTLTEQVEAAVSAQQSPAPAQTGFPQPFPPAPSQSPLPAPAAQRTGRASVADQLQTESRDLSQTPSVDVETPSAAVAPWAKEPAEAPKGPSFKELQEIEAKKAAEREVSTIRQVVSRLAARDFIRSWRTPVEIYAS